MMDADLTAGRPVRRRMSIVVRKLLPLQREMGALQGRLAFISGKRMFAQRKAGIEDLAEDLAESAASVARLRALLSAVIESLPAKARSDTKLFDTRLALDRADDAIAALAVGPQSSSTVSIAPACYPQTIEGRESNMLQKSRQERPQTS